MHTKLEIFKIAAALRNEKMGDWEKKKILGRRSEKEMIIAEWP